MNRLIAELPKHPWHGALHGHSASWFLNLTPPMRGILRLGKAAQEPSLRALRDQPGITDQIRLLLGGAGDEKVIPIVIRVMMLSLRAPESPSRQRLFLAGSLALTNITVEDVNWHRGGGLTIDACPVHPAGCWAAWWEQNKATVKVTKMKHSRNYTNYPMYGLYGEMTRSEPWPPPR